MKLSGGVLILILLVCSLVFLRRPGNATPLDTTNLSDALLKQDLAGIKESVAKIRTSLKGRAGIPENDVIVKIPKLLARSLNESLRDSFLMRSQKVLEESAVPSMYTNPSELRRPLRTVAEAILFFITLRNAGITHTIMSRAKALSERGAQFLMWAQNEGGSGVYPFPSYMGPSNERAIMVAQRFLRRARSQGLLKKVLHNGWSIDDLGDGGLQFDNGECGYAMLLLGDALDSPAIVRSGLLAADWALQRPLATNWNYNSFSVLILAQAYRMTRTHSYLEGAVKKAVLGVIPGQLTEGPQAGRWIDPHNASDKYHAIMLRALTVLLGVMPPHSPSRDQVRTSIKNALIVFNDQIISKGIADKNNSYEALSEVLTILKDDLLLIKETRTQEAFNLLNNYLLHELNAKKEVVSPKVFALLIAQNPS